MGESTYHYAVGALRLHTDQELVICLRQGDVMAFDELYRRYVPKLLTFANSFFSSKEIAEEAVQEIFIRIWERRTELDHNKRFNAYLFQSVKFYMYNYLRDRKESYRIEDVPEGVFGMTYTMEEDLEYERLEARAFSIIDHLPHVQREIFRLNKLEGWSTKEIAQKTKLSKRTIEHHLYLATKTIRSKISKEVSLTLLLLFFMME